MLRVFFKYIYFIQSALPKQEYFKLSLLISTWSGWWVGERLVSVRGPQKGSEVRVFLTYAL